MIINIGSKSINVSRFDSKEEAYSSLFGNEIVVTNNDSYFLINPNDFDDLNRIGYERV